MKDLRSRLARLEDVFCRHPLVVEAVDPTTGKAVRETAADMIDNNHLFYKVIGGDNADDMARVLDYFVFCQGITPGSGFLTKEFQDKAKAQALDLADTNSIADSERTVEQ